MATTITATIGAYKIKVCEVSHSSKGTVIQKAFILKTPIRCVEDGRILNVEAIAKVLGEAITEYGITTKNVTFVLKSSKIAYKEVITPVLRPSKLSEMIKANASEYFPVDIENYTITEKVLAQVESPEGGKQLRVSVYAAPKEMVDAYYELAEKMKLNILNIEVENNASVSILKKQIGEEQSVVIQVHADSTTVNVFKGNVLELQRTVPYGKNIVLDALMEKNGITEDEAESLLATERLIHNTFDGDEVTESLKYLINSIVRVVDYYTSRSANNVIEKAYLTGESVLMLGLENLFANEFQFSVMQIMEFNGVTVAPNLILEQKLISLYISCVGAVYDPVNLETDRASASGRGKDKTIQYLIIGIAASFAIGLIAVAVPFVQNLSLKSEIRDTQEKIDAIKDVEIIVGQYYDAKDRYSDVDSFAGVSSSASDYLLDFIGALEKGQPSDVSIKSMSVKNGQVSITAATSTKQSIAKFITQLKGMNGVSDVFVASSTETKDSYGVVTSTFSLVCSFNSGIELYIDPTLQEVTEEDEAAGTETEEEVE